MYFLFLVISKLFVVGWFLYDFVIIILIRGISNKSGINSLGVNVRQSVEVLANDKPHIVVGTPGRILDLVNRKAMDLSHVKHFVMDECDRLIAEIAMRRDIQNIFKVGIKYRKPVK